jgi:hypothetical protein
MQQRQDANIQVGEHCFNRDRIEQMQPPLGKLRRICPIRSITWTKCQFVHPHYKSEGCKNKEPMLQMSEANGIDVSRATHKGSHQSPMIVEMISNEIDRLRIATFLRFEFEESSNDYCLEEIYEFGFTHIIILGTFNYGSVFLDCYGHVFKMDVMSDVLWFIGNSLEEASTKSWPQAAVWTVEDDGTIYESEHCKYANIHSFLQ